MHHCTLTYQPVSLSIVTVVCTSFSPCTTVHFVGTITGNTGLYTTCSGCAVQQEPSTLSRAWRTARSQHSNHRVVHITLCSPAMVDTDSSGLHTPVQLGIISDRKGLHLDRAARHMRLHRVTHILM